MVFIPGWGFSYSGALPLDRRDGWPGCECARGPARASAVARWNPRDTAFLGRCETSFHSRFIPESSSSLPGPEPGVEDGRGGRSEEVPEKSNFSVSTSRRGAGVGGGEEEHGGECGWVTDAGCSWPGHRRHIPLVSGALYAAVRRARARRQLQPAFKSFEQGSEFWQAHL